MGMNYWLKLGEYMIFVHKICIMLNIIEGPLLAKLLLLDKGIQKEVVFENPDLSVFLFLIVFLQQL